MRKLSVVVGLAVASAALIGIVGCGLTTTISAPKISLDNTIGSIAISSSGSATANVTGKISGDTAITAINCSIVDSNKVAVPTSEISASSPQAGLANSQDFATTITVNSTATAGTYYLMVSATAGVDGSAYFVFTVTGGGSTPTLTEVSVTLGASGATEPSGLDAIDMQGISCTLSTSDADIEKIDAIFWYSTVVSPAALSFISPASAQGQPFDSWDAASKNASQFEFAPSNVDWSSIQTQADVDGLWVSGGGTDRVVVSEGDIIIIKTASGVNKAVLISSIGGSGNSATVLVKGLI